MFLIIIVALKLRAEINAFIRKSEVNQEDYKRVLERNHFISEDWRILAETKEVLKPFFDCTKELKEKTSDATHSSL